MLKLLGFFCSCSCQLSLTRASYWVAAKELKKNHHKPETILFPVYP